MSIGTKWGERKHTGEVGGSVNVESITVVRCKSYVLLDPLNEIRLYTRFPHQSTSLNFQGRSEKRTLEMKCRPKTTTVFFRFSASLMAFSGWKPPATRKVAGVQMLY